MGHSRADERNGVIEADGTADEILLPPESSELSSVRVTPAQREWLLRSIASTNEDECVEALEFLETLRDEDDRS